MSAAIGSRTAKPKAPQKRLQRQGWSLRESGPQRSPASSRRGPPDAGVRSSARCRRAITEPPLAQVGRRARPPCAGDRSTLLKLRVRNLDVRRSGRWAGLLVWLPLLLAIVLTGDVARAQGGDAFRQFLEGIWPEAQAVGVSRATFDAALRGVEPDLALPDLVLPGKGEVKGQAEFTRTPAQYLSAPYLANLTEQGTALQAQHAAWLGKIEKELGVQRQFVLAIWGRETAYG